MQVNYTKLLM